MKSKKLLLSTAILLSLVSCGGGSSEVSNSISENTEVKITDLANRKLTIDTSKVNKVVCVGAGALRLYSYVGDMNKLSGAEDIDRTTGEKGSNPFVTASRPYYDVNKDLLKNLPTCGLGGPMHQSAEADKILACEPDVVFSLYTDPKAANDLQEKLGGIPVVVLKYGQQSVFDENIKKSLRVLGQVLNKSEKAENLISYIDTSKTELQNKTKDVKDEDKESVYIGCLGNWGKQSIYSTSTSYPLFTVSGIKNVLEGNVSLTQGNVDPGSFVASNPDKIIIDAAGVDLFKTTYSEDPEKFNAMNAFKNGEIYLQMPFNAYYTNLEIALMDAYYDASVVFTEQYKGFDLDAKCKEISEAFLGVDCYDSIKNAKSSHGGFQKISNPQEFFAA
jgi:iron complex transport system substrate-binding protein